uniref:Alpha/beta hydrolase fold-3 domain-containing protein n=1 Tax=Aegilops tauschii subsp. strangulata TaxID=200361 RepID=A0A453M228_AEGTS
MAAAAPIPAPAPAADDEIVYESMPCIRIYKDRVERYFGSEFVAASADADAATGVASRDRVISPEVSARLYLPRLDPAKDSKLPVLVYYHGGGFCLGSAFNPTFHAYFNNLAALAGVLVVSVEYRLAPEHPVPAAYADSSDALAWVVSHAAPGAAAAGFEPWLADHADFARLYLGGESAGANIAHHVAMRVGAEGLPHGADIWQAPGKGHTFHLLEPCCEEAVAQDKVIAEFLNH